MFNPRKLFTYLLNKIPSKGIFDFYFSRMNPSNFGMVVTLHRVTKPANGTLLNNFIEITDRKLEETILNLQKLDVQFISLGELQGYLKQDRKPERPLVHVSFDDGYLDNFTIAYPILKKHQIPFSIFISSDFIDNERPFLWWYIIEAIINHEHPVSFDKYNFSINAADYRSKNKDSIFSEFRSLILEHLENDRTYFDSEFGQMIERMASLEIPEMLTWNQLKIMHESGYCELGIHTRRHARFRYLTAEEKRGEIMDCREAIILNTGVVPKYFSFPYGAAEDIGNTDGLQDLLKSCGVEAAFTTSAGELNGQCNPFFIPRFFITNATTNYSLQSRLNGSYQREVLAKHLDRKLSESEI